jgi:hypothetical protein
MRCSPWAGRLASRHGRAAAQGDKQALNKRERSQAVTARTSCEEGCSTN